MEEENKLMSETWSSFMKVDMTDGIKNVEDSIEDTLTRLEEFTGVIDVLRRDTNIDVAFEIMARKPELMLLFEKVRKLETIIETVKKTVDSFEHVVTKAESDLDFNAEGKLFNYLKPLFFKKHPAPRPTGVSPSFTNPPIFSTKDLFSN